MVRSPERGDAHRPAQEARRSPGGPRQSRTGPARHLEIPTLPSILLRRNDTRRLSFKQVGQP